MLEIKGMKSIKCIGYHRDIDKLIVAEYPDTNRRFGDPVNRQKQVKSRRRRNTETKLLPDIFTYNAAKSVKTMQNQI